MVACCGKGRKPARLAAGDELAKELAGQVDEIWKRKGMPKRLNRKVTRLYANTLMEGVEKGYGRPVSGIDYDTPDGNMLKNLTKNVYQFSAAKNYTQMRQLTQALIGDDHKLRTKSQFKRAAFEINEAHVGHWLDAEYELCVAGSQMASKWVDITSNPATKYLEFDVVLDKKTSDTCRPLHGVVVPVDHPMLAIYFPPNHFYCRTTVRQLTNGTPTPDHQMNLPEIPPMFRTNLGKQGLVFPKGHSYWVGVPNDVLQEALRMAIPDTWLPVEDGKILIHSRVDPSAKDFSEVMETAYDFAGKGEKVHVMPTISDTADPLYGKLFKGAKAGKCPDLMVGDEFVEVKAVTKMSRNTIKHAIDQASTQADHVVVQLPGRTEWKQLKGLARLKFGDHKQLQVIQFKMDDAYYRFTREALLK